MRYTGRKDDQWKLTIEVIKAWYNGLNPLDAELWVKIQKLSEESEFIKNESKLYSSVSC